MSRKIPYLQRRNDALEFRISVPHALRKKMGKREIVKTLKTQDRRTAAPLALLLASRAKQLFIRLHNMTDDGTIKINYELGVVFNEAGEISGMNIKTEPDDKQVDIDSAIRTVFEGNAIARQRIQTIQAPPPIYTDALQAPQNASNYTLNDAIGDFLATYAGGKSPAMLKRHKQVLQMLLDVIGDKPVSKLKQTDISGFFALIERLPPDWDYQCRQLKMTLMEMAELDHDETIEYKTFKNGYVSSVRPFIRWAVAEKGDENFPFRLNTDAAEKNYQGSKELGLNKQRALKDHELTRLFQGDEMKVFASDATQHHKFWLMHLALFTGGRVNELCQLNPQTDIFQDPDSGVWLIWITAETPGDSRIVKSVKTGESRKVPIHKTLIELGFLEYVERVKSSGKKLIFPEFKPVSKRASRNAEFFFIRLLKNTNLRDDTPKAKIVGMHCFRHTLLSYGAKEPKVLDLTLITGHAQLPFKVTGSAGGYFDKSITNKIEGRQVLLNQLEYEGLTFFKPS